jgi:signal peptidase I
MMQDVRERRLPSWIAVLLKPRDTIERITANVSSLQIVALACLSGFAGIASYLIELRIVAELRDWRVLLIAMLTGAVIGVIQLYVVAFLIAWFGRKLGSDASVSRVRAALAWGAMPIILGGALIVVIVFSSSSARWLASVLQVTLGVCGLWSTIVTLLMLSRIQRLGAWRTISVYSVCALLFPFLLALAIRTFLFQPFNTPSSAMAPTLLPGDYFFASKFSYGFGVQPQRGDVVVLSLPKDESKDKSTVYLKRVIGVGGDRIQMKSGQLYLNGNAVTRERLPDYTVAGLCGESTAAVKRWRETLPNGVSYETLDCLDNAFYDNTAEYVVPAGHVFVMGDNRDNSTDSRVQSSFGTIPVGNVFGRAGMIFLSREETPNGGASLRVGRIGTFVR